MPVARVAMPCDIVLPTYPLLTPSLLLFPTLQACEPAARMALNDVNSNPALLPGYQLKLHWNDSGVSE